MNRTMRTTPTLRLLTSVLLAAAVAGCALGPAYERPTTPAPVAFKELNGWAPAAPADALDRGPWWNLFADPVLDEPLRQADTPPI